MSSEGSPAHALEAHAKSKPRARKRAAKACLACRTRKVRCDVTHSGRPCTNCTLDNERCVVVERQSKFGCVTFPCLRQPSVDLENTKATTETISRVPGDLDLESPCILHEIPSDRKKYRRGKVNWIKNVISPKNASTQGHPYTNTNSLDSFVDSHISLSDPPPATTGDIWLDSPSNHPYDLRINSEVRFSCYSFLNLRNAQNLSSPDALYLESEGCFRVPTKSILDEFMRKYFLYIHPSLPFLNEGNFWNSYKEYPSSTIFSINQGQLPLVLFQAMLFACCHYVPETTLSVLGFTNIRTAYETLYRRSKLLFDHETETCPIGLSQAALLLSFWVPTPAQISLKPNVTWLLIAIQHAKSAEAHQYARFQSQASELHCKVSSIEVHKANTLKRLWWCCVIRDSALSLALRQPTQITRAHFDFDVAQCLGPSDLLDEESESQVYRPIEKRNLAEALYQLIKLSVMLIDMLELTALMQGDFNPRIGRPITYEKRTEGIKNNLRTWYLHAKMQFSTFYPNEPPHELPTKEGHPSKQDSIALLFVSTIMLQYHSAYTMILHYEIFNQVINANSLQPDQIPNLNRIITSSQQLELNAALCDTYHCLKHLVNSRLAPILPSTVVSCIAFPLALQALCSRLLPQVISTSPRFHDSDNNNVIQIDPRLSKTLTSTVTICRDRYGGTDWILDAVQHSVDLATMLNPPVSKRGLISDVTSDPDHSQFIYLRVAYALNVALHFCRLPRGIDFPVTLRTIEAFITTPFDYISKPNTGMRSSTKKDLGQLSDTSRVIPSTGVRIHPTVQSPDAMDITDPKTRVEHLRCPAPPLVPQDTILTPAYDNDATEWISIVTPEESCGQYQHSNCSGNDSGSLYQDADAHHLPANQREVDETMLDTLVDEELSILLNIDP